MAVRFLQIGDTHLGAALTSLPEDLAQQLRQAVRDIVAEAFATASRENAALVLLPGDLFEQDGSEPAAQLRFIYEQAETVAPAPVVITPGNHDSYHSDSPYATTAVPGNVVLFTSSELTMVKTPVARVIGRAVQAGERSSALQWSQAPRGADGLSVLVLHASVLGAGDGRLRRNTVVPMTQQQLTHTGYAYTAVGHYHRFQAWQRPNQELACAAYAGCPQGLGWDEPGERGYLLGELEQAGARLTFKPADRHRWHRRTITLPPEYLADADARLIADVQAVYDELKPADLLELSVQGRWPEAQRERLQELFTEVKGQVLYARPVDWSAVDFFPPLVERGASEAVDEFLTRCEQGLAALDEDADETERRAWRLARYLGLRMLSGQGLPGEVA
jgi:DNA repair exonuclease SbcCD nuclease subunit